MGKKKNRYSILKIILLILFFFIFYAGVFLLHHQNKPIGTYRRCTHKETRDQILKKSLANVNGCSLNKELWLEHIRMSIPGAKLFVDIGSNKGFTSASFFGIWDKNSGINPRGLFLSNSAKREKGADRFDGCGACNECLDNSNSSHSMNNNIKVYSYDANIHFVDRLKESVGNIAPLLIHEKKWEIHHAAFVEKYRRHGFVPFEMGLGEVGHLSFLDGVKKHGKKTSMVPVLTIDFLIKSRNIPHVDIVKIDTEGYDSFVIRGAKKSLREHKITLLIFEFNNIWPKNQLSLLNETILLLEMWTYICYHVGDNYLVRLTSCYNPLVVDVVWSNVICVSYSIKEGKNLIDIFDKHSLAFLEED